MLGIESVRGGHVGGVNNKNIFAWELNFFPKENSFTVSLLQHGRRAHTLLSSWVFVMPMGIDPSYNN